MKQIKLSTYLILSNILLPLTVMASGLPTNISELVDEAAPAVVNITSNKQVSQQQSYGYGGIPDEMLERFGIPKQYREAPQQKKKISVLRFWFYS
jgi:serine protease Do